MKTLKNLTDLLKEVGLRQTAMERSYKRRDHREVLIRGWITFEGKIKERRAQADALFAKLEESGFELTFKSFDSDGELWVMAKVELADGF